MKTVFSLLLGLVMALGVSACQATPAPSLAPATATAAELAETSTPPDPGSLPATSTTVETIASPTMDSAGLKIALGYSIREPAILPDGYTLESVTVDEATRSVCLQYRFPHAELNNVLLISQGPAQLAPPLGAIPGWPEYPAPKETAIGIGGAEKSFQLLGKQRSAWACTASAQAQPSQFSFVVAPQLTWEIDHQQFDLYAANGGCGTPGGLTTLDLLRVAEGLTGQSTHAADELAPECLRSIADAEKLAGFDIKEPAYLPENVAFYFAAYEKLPSPGVILRFFHTEHPDMGIFFQLTQQTEASPSYAASCEKASSDGCEILQIGAVPVVYRYTDTGGHGTEQFDWSADGFFFSLFRSAGEPGKTYKDELVKMIASLK